MIKIAVIGLGNRGSGYMNIVKLFCKKDAQIVALCDIFEKRLEECRIKYNIPADMCFTNEDDFFSKGKLADAIFICTQDRDHYNHALKAIELGYDIMCEKPLSPSIKECIDLVEKAEAKGVKMLVCHVLRYSKYYSKIKEIIDSGVIGEVVSLDHTENIGYFHFAHSYVRGNWRDSNTTTPMIMAKTCHDLDLIHWFMDGGCISVSAFGSLNHFRKEKAPEGAADRCLNGCKVKDSCPYDAERLYITAPLRKATFLRFMGRTITGKQNATQDDKYKALKEGDYGRCVYHSDNNVCDNYTVNMSFDNNRTASLTVTAFSKKMYRHSHIMGTLGELRGRDNNGVLELSIYNGKSRRIRTKYVPLPGHLSGDIGLVRDFVDMLNNKPTRQKDLTLVDVTLFSHKMAMAAEESRLNKGKVVLLDNFKG